MGAAALPCWLAGWLAEEYAPRFNLHPITLGREGIANQIFLGMREADADIDYVRAFVELAAAHQLDI
jgi:LysR family transcriptional regulator for metE and metH